MRRKPLFKETPMHTLALFVEFVLGFAPFALVVAAIITALWAATKLFPSFGAWCAETFDRLMGVDAEYDEKYIYENETTRYPRNRETRLDTYV
jgi:hypothetical protein